MKTVNIKNNYNGLRTDINFCMLSENCDVKRFFLNTAKTRARKDELRFQFSFWISFVNRSFTF